jgi:hypothetical protein
MTIHEDPIYAMLQNVSNNVLSLVRDTGEMRGQIDSLGKEINEIKESQKKSENEQRNIKELLQGKMTPDRCAFVNAELETRIIATRGKGICISAHEDLKKQIFLDLKEGAKGWGKTAIMILKVAAWAAVLFGGSAVGANALGLIKITGG